MHLIFRETAAKILKINHLALQRGAGGTSPPDVDEHKLVISIDKALSRLHLQ